MDENIRQEIKEGIVSALKQVASDKEFIAAFWRGGYEELIKHGGNGASQWVGQRILTWLSAAALVAALTWYVNTHGGKS